MNKSRFFIKTEQGKKIMEGYTFQSGGILFGVDERGARHWIITELSLGLKVSEVSRLKYAPAEAERFIEQIKYIYEKQYIKNGYKVFYVLPPYLRKEDN